MIKDHIIREILTNLRYTPTHGQEKIISNLASFIIDSDINNVFLIKGYAGTGKTSLIAALVRTIYKFKIKSVLMAPTGRAAKVLSAYTSLSATTIHKRIYRQKTIEDESVFSLDRNNYMNTIFIVDEASMIGIGSYEQNRFGSGDLLSDMIKYIQSGRNCKLIIIGDNAQLPPVGFSESPALDENRLSSFFSNVYTNELTEVVRQDTDSGILFNATKIRNQIDNNYQHFPIFNISDYPDIESINGSDLIEKISDAFDKYGTDETIVISRSNKRANLYNQGIRGNILYSEEGLTNNDRVMVVKNNYQFLGEESPMDFIANGDIAIVKRIKKYYERYGMKYVDVSLYFEDYETEIDTRIMLDVLSLESASLPSDKIKELFYNVFEDYSYITNKRKRYLAIREDPFFNALQVKFAYAITCHKAQGGQWDCVFLDRPFFGEDDFLSIENLRWMYTALTRAKKKIYLVNFEKKYLV